MRGISIKVTIPNDLFSVNCFLLNFKKIGNIIGAEQSASGAPHFRVPSSEFRAPRWGGWRTSELRVPSKEERKTEGGEHPSSEFRVKKKERKTEGGKHPSQRVANIRVPSSE